MPYHDSLDGASVSRTTLSHFENGREPDQPDQIVLTRGFLHAASSRVWQARKLPGLSGPVIPRQSPETRRGDPRSRYDADMARTTIRESFSSRTESLTEYVDAVVRSVLFWTVVVVGGLATVWQVYVQPNHFPTVVFVISTDQLLWIFIAAVVLGGFSAFHKLRIERRAPVPAPLKMKTALGELEIGKPTREAQMAAIQGIAVTRDQGTLEPPTLTDEIPTPAAQQLPTYLTVAGEPVYRFDYLPTPTPARRRRGSRPPASEASSAPAQEADTDREP